MARIKRKISKAKKQKFIVRRPLNLPDDIWQKYKISQNEISSIKNNEESTGKLESQKEKVSIEQFVPLNLPDDICQKYKVSQNEISSIKNNEKPIGKLESQKEKDVIEKSDVIDNGAIINEKKNETPDDLLSEKKPANDFESKGKEKNILDHLAIRIDNSYAAQYNCLFLSQKLKKFSELHKFIYQKIMNAKEILTNFSIRSMIQPNNVTNSLTSHIISANEELENSLKSLQDQDSIFLDFEKTVNELSLPLAIVNYNNVQQTNYQVLSSLLGEKENEIEILKHKTIQLEEQLFNYKRILKKKEEYYGKIITNKSKCITELRKKIHLTKHHQRIMSEGSMKYNSSNDKPSLNQVQQLRNLMALTNSLMENILGGPKQVSISESELLKKKDDIISKLNEELSREKKKNHQIIRENIKLIRAEQRTRKELKALEIEKCKAIREKNHRVIQLTSSLDNMKRKQNRWLTDIFHQKCHSIMLFEKLRQLENRNGYSSIEKVEKG